LDRQNSEALLQFEGQPTKKFLTQPNQMHRSATIFVLALLLVSINCDSALACPTCKSALHHGLALGYAISILFMMAMPFVIFAFWAVTIVRLRAKAKPLSLVEFTLNSPHRET